MKMPERLLLALDFDHTVIDDNSDTWITKLGEGGSVPSRIKSTYETGRWTAFMNTLLEYLYKECNVTKTDLSQALREIPFTKHMDDVLKFTREMQKQIDCIIISDSNSWFISTILEERGFSDVLCGVFTNEAVFTDNGQLKVICHHKHNHDACPVNLCKGDVLQKFIADQSANGVSYHKICYVGDGGNDLCPATRLSERDVLFARKGYALERKLQRASQLKCSVVMWDSGLDILRVLQESAKPKY